MFFQSTFAQKKHMLVNVYGAKCVGIDAMTVTVEVDIRSGIGIHLVGLADTAVKESLLRTVNALQALDFHIPGKKIVINLAPADMHKSGSCYDLPIALGIIAASEQKTMPVLGEFVIMGELGLDGSVRDVSGALPVAQMAGMHGYRGCILPIQSALEAVELREMEVYGIKTIDDAIRILSGEGNVSDLLIWNTREYHELQEEMALMQDCMADAIDFSEIIGQESAKRGVEIAAAGGHNVALIGSPGSGKSSLAKAMAGILPPMSREESLVTSKIYSVAGRGKLRYGLIRQRPVRSPHYSASVAALIGGGNGDNILPGEVSLAQSGLLFLDEFGQMSRTAIEALRGPLEDRKVVISRLRAKVEYPASFMLVAASNPCPCGYFGEGDRCNCSVGQRTAYLSHLSGPILDRIDIQLVMRRVDTGRMLSRHEAESSAVVAERVRKARDIQQKRFEGEGISTNAEMNNRQIARFCQLSDECRETLQNIIERMQLSMRAFYRIIKVSRTIADLDGRKDIEVGDILEAASYRILDREYPM